MPTDPTFKKISELPATGELSSTDALLLLKGENGSLANQRVSTSVLESFVRQASAVEANRLISSANLDKISNAKEAALFLKNTTLGPTPGEIDELVGMGSKREWMLEQISSSFDNSTYSEWQTSATEITPRAGWFSEIGLAMKFPTNYTDPGGTGLSYYNPGSIFTNRAILTAFVRNNPTVGGVGSISDTSIKDSKKSLLCKVTWILNKLIPVSKAGGGFEDFNDSWPIIGWYSLLARNAFRNYTDILEEIAYNISMARMLTHIKNQKSDGTGRQPDENFAREIMQLFSLGLYKLNVDGTFKLDKDGNRILNYDNSDIFEMSKVFTGLTRWDRPDEEYYTSTTGVNSIMLGGGDFLQGITRIGFVDSQTVFGIKKPASSIEKGKTYRVAEVNTTDFTKFGGANTVGNIFVATANGNPTSGPGVVEERRIYPSGVIPRLKHYLPWYETGSKIFPNVGINIPAGTDPETNIKMAVRGLVSHPSCAPNISKNLIKLSTTSNPSPGYVARVASVFRDNGKGVAGDMAAVWIAIFTDPEANLSIDSSNSKGRVRDGFESYCNIARSFDGMAPIQSPSSVPTPPSGIFSDQEYKAVYINGVRKNSVALGVLWDYRYSELGSWPFSSPSVFSYYSLDYSITPANDWGILVPEVGSLPANTLMSAIVIFSDIVNNRDPVAYRALNGAGYASSRTYITSYSDILGTLIDDYNGTTELVNKLSLLLCGGNLSNRKKSLLKTFLNTMPIGTQDQKDSRVSVAIQLIFRSPEFWVS